MAVSSLRAPIAPRSTCFHHWINLRNVTVRVLSWQARVSALYWKIKSNCYYKWNCSFPITPHVRRPVSWLVCLTLFSGGWVVTLPWLCIWFEDDITYVNISLHNFTYHRVNMYFFIIWGKPKDILKISWIIFP